jgi:hypothetical protein
VKERPQRSESLTLAALPSAVNSARSFVVSTLERWRAPLVIGDAVHLVEEMVASAVRTTGVADPNVQWRTLTHLELLTVTLVGLRNSIGMEVWDNAPSWPAQPVNEPALDRELLEVLKTAAGQWGIMPSGRGRVVWAKLPIYARAESGLPVWPRIPSPRPRQAATLPKTPDLELLQRVREGLEQL